MCVQKGRTLIVFLLKVKEVSENISINMGITFMGLNSCRVLYKSNYEDENKVQQIPNEQKIMDYE